jgi:hypothetical protein
MKRPPARRDRRCLFCGALPSDTRLIARLDGLVCVECFEEIGKMFSEPKAVPFFVHSETCISCNRTARTRLLVSGIGAAICRGCYVAIIRTAKSVDLVSSTGPPQGERARDLGRLRAVRLRARRQYERLHKNYRSVHQRFRSLRRPDQTSYLISVALDAVLAQRKTVPPLCLVTSRERIRGGRALKLWGDEPGARMAWEMRWRQ